MKVLVIGANGQLGSDLCKELDSTQLVPLTHSDIEITDMNSIKRVFETYQLSRGDVVINTAAYVSTDKCETNPDKAFLVNALGAGNVAIAAQEWGAKLVHISTGYVFGGEKERRATPYTEFDIPNPVNTYGRSKLAGENLVASFSNRYLIVRFTGLFGIRGARGKGGNFIETILRLAGENSELKVVSDQICSLTYTRDAAKKIAQLLPTDYYGIFHISNEGSCSWHEFACEILSLAGITTPVIPITSDEFHSVAKRPAFSALDNYHLRLLGMDDLRPWREALKDYMKERALVSVAREGN